MAIYEHKSRKIKGRKRQAGDKETRSNGALLQAGGDEDQLFSASVCFSLPQGSNKFTRYLFITLKTHKVLIQTLLHFELTIFGILPLCTENKKVSSELKDLATIT